MVDRRRAESVHPGADDGNAAGRGAQNSADSAPVHSPPILCGEELNEAVMRSLKLAAKDAHLLAYRTGTGVVTRRNGEVAVVAPDPAMYEDLVPPPFRERHQPSE